jgi:hypothetical protein
MYTPKKLPINEVLNLIQDVADITTFKEKLFGEKMLYIHATNPATITKLDNLLSEQSASFEVTGSDSLTIIVDVM